MKLTERIREVVPPNAMALFALAESRKAQSSLEYIMMVSAASIVIVLALAMVIKLKGAVVSSVSVNGTNMSVSQAIGKELGSLTAGGA
jgi:hypothetical protein